MVETYLRNMETMMSCVVNIDTITKYGSCLPHQRHTLDRRRSFEDISMKIHNTRGKSSSNGDLAMTEDGQYYSEGEMIRSVGIHS